MTVFVNHVKEGLEMEVAPTQGKSKNRSKKGKVKEFSPQTDTNFHHDPHQLSPPDETLMPTTAGKTITTRSIELTPTKDKRRKNNRCCCC